MNRNRRRAPRRAVVEKAANVSLTNSWESQSYRGSPVRQPMISMITAKIGTPRMNAAKFRWSWATAHTARREPRRGKARYAGSRAASWAWGGSVAASASAAAQKTSHAQWKLPRVASDEELVLAFTGATSANL